MTTRTNFKPANVPIIPDRYPEWRIIDQSRKFENSVNSDRDVPGEMLVARTQVQSFMLLTRLHDYLAYARHELESIIGTSLCKEFCCCLKATPFITRIEAEYIVSMNGYYSDLVDIAENWLLYPHPEAQTYPKEIPGAVGGRLQNFPDVAAQTKSLHHLRSPFLLASDHLTRQFISGRYISGSHEHGENWDLLEDTQPLSCITTGLTKSAPEWCQRRLGLGEGDGSRIIADSFSLQGHIKNLWSYCQKNAPDKLYFGLLPTMLFMVGNPVRFEELAKSGKIALAKLGVVRRVFPPNTYPIKMWN